MDSKFIEKLKKSELTGRGGAGFPTWQKWELFAKAFGEPKYIVCNCAEGEPGVEKDRHILENHPEDVVAGIKVALDTFPKSQAYIYIRKDYHQKFGPILEKLVGNLPIKLFQKTGGYLAGEESTICSVLTDGKIEPKIRPPYPCDCGILDKPTLVNNLETFYHIAQVEQGQYKKTRFYTISGDIKNSGVFELPEDFTIEQVLKKTDNYPDFDPSVDEAGFFVQSGGAMSGEIKLSDELDQTVRGQGAIVVYDKYNTDPDELLERWIDFFYKENCDKCVPCREGVYRIKEMLQKQTIKIQTLKDIFYVMEKTSFCALGSAVVVPVKSLIEKIYEQ
ncbi:NADH-ubiquinone oxidoreductase-F iron-sulfur binding region domain-containing protein [Patescibacteria group bacterium]